MQKESLVGQTKRYIIEIIGSGEILPGSKMIPVRKLSEKFNVSHVTAATAVRELVNEGILASKKGSGTFIAEKLPFRLLHTESKAIRRPLYFFFRNIHSDSSYHSAIFCTLQNECASRNWEICANELSKENLFAVASDPNAAGVVFAPIQCQYPIFKCPVVNYDIGDNGIHVYPMVMPDYFSAGYNAGLLLLKKNILDPCFITAVSSPESLPGIHFDSIYNGLNHAYKMHRLPPLKILPWAINHPCRKVVEDLLDTARNRRLVLVVGNRSMASEIYISLTSNGLHVPHDVGILTFIKRCSQDLKTPLDTFDFDQKQMSMEILNLLDRANNREQLPLTVNVPLSYSNEGSL